VGREPRSLLDLAVYVAAGLLVLATAAFALYYHLDRRSDSGPSLIERRIAALEEAVRAQPDVFGPRLALATAYETKKRYADARRQYEAALIIEPESAEAYLGLGRVNQAGGDIAGAAAAFEAVVALRKDSEFASIDNFLQEAHFYLGEIALSQKEYGAAIGAFLAAVAIQKTDADAWYGLCQAYLGATDFENAAASCERSVELVPDFAEPYSPLAEAYRKLGRPLKARYAEAMTAYASGRSEQAIASLEAVVAEDAELWQAHVGLGLALEVAGRRDEARQAFKRALTGDPANFVARLGLARLGGQTP